jgi:TonB family protein
MFRHFLLITLLLAAAAPARSEDDSLIRAKELYLSASYDEALSALESATIDGPAALEAWQYRAFCFLALQRQDDARKIIERIYNTDPFFQLSETQTAPRVLGVFREVRRGVLPSIVQQEYAAARRAFEGKETQATSRFDYVLTLMDDPDVRSAITADFRLVVSGFRDLSEARMAVVAPVAPPPVTPTLEPSKPAAERVVIVRPVAISRPMPVWAPTNSGDAKLTFTGQLEVDIDEGGHVTSATIVDPIYPRYDEDLLQYVRRWRFKPATRNGRPTAFEIIVPIRLGQDATAASGRPDQD